MDHDQNCDCGQAAPPLLGWWNRLRFRLGFKPFRRCPGPHIWRQVWGDEINVLESRWVCINCSTREGQHYPVSEAPPNGWLRADVTVGYEKPWTI